MAAVRSMAWYQHRLDEQMDDLNGVIDGAIADDWRGTPNRVVRMAGRMQDTLEMIIRRAFQDRDNLERSKKMDEIEVRLTRLSGQVAGGGRRAKR